MSFPVVLVFDTTFAQKMITVPPLKKLYKEKSVTTVHWSSQLPCVTRSLPALVKFDYRIEGHINGFKSNMQLRRVLIKKPALLSHPVILIDTHPQSLNLGGFDYTINLSETKAQNFLFSGFDTVQIANQIEIYRKNWHTVSEKKNK